MGSRSGTGEDGLLEEIICFNCAGMVRKVGVERLKAVEGVK